ncbi:MAG: ATP-binding protein [Sandaracinaceae bacterium]|nr:ATP-binding protein [Sandaracinaceae bacterium]
MVAPAGVDDVETVKTRKDGTRSQMTLTTSRGRKVALAALDVGRLRELVDQAGVVVQDRRARESLIKALSDARRVDFSTLIGGLSRDELKAMCRALGVPDDGRDKAKIIARLSIGADGDDGHAQIPLDGVSLEKPWRTKVIELLKRDELADVAEMLDVHVSDRRVHRELCIALERSTASLDEVLENLPRARLKEVCRELGLDDSGKDKATIILRIADHGADAEDHDEANRDANEVATSAPPHGPEAIGDILGAQLSVEVPGAYWPAMCTLALGELKLAVDLHVRPIGGTGRNPLERRFQNPAKGTPISPTSGRPCLLVGFWVEQGLDRAVLVAFDAYRRRDRTTRFSLFMPLSVLEEAADIGFVSHVNGKGEKLYAFRPDGLGRYLDAFSEDATWGNLDPGTWARPTPTSRTPTVRPVATLHVGDMVEIRPRAGMFAAFARLNYKPWFALAELVDNAVQSFLSNREELEAAGSTGPLVVDIHIEGDELSVTDRAAGIRLEDFPRAFSPATPPSDSSGLSEFGLGMKAAACWFADEWSVRTSTLGEEVERSISFDVPKITMQGLDHLPIQTRVGRPGDHFTVITMRRLRVRLRGSTLTKVKDHLASIYRLLIADGTVRIRLTTSGKSEELTYTQPPLLTAPFYMTPNGPPILWRQEIDVEHGSRRITGWAGLMESGKHSRAGFSVFRRRRLIEGSVGEAYRPRHVFGAHNSFASQRLVGELYVEGFEVTHTKDGIQWGDDEDGLAIDIRMQLDSVEMPMLDQASGYRSRRTAAALPGDFGRAAIEATAASAALLTVSTKAPDPTIASQADTEISPRALKSSGDTLQQRSFRMVVDGDQEWDVRIELVREPGAVWLDSSVSRSEDGQEHLQIRVNLDHSFSEEHLNDNERALEPILRVAVAVAVGEWQARTQGVSNSGAVRRNANALLRQGLSSAPLEQSRSEDR